jgi:hypothetical protein
MGSRALLKAKSFAATAHIAAVVEGLEKDRVLAV